MISIHSVTYNEEFRLQYMIDHYRSRFKNCNFTFYDCNSTDETVNILKRNNVNISESPMKDMNDQILMEIKNNCWKNSPTDWVLVCDPDELLNINEDDLKKENDNGVTIIKATAFNMIGAKDKVLNLKDIKMGIRAPMYDKCYLFNKANVNEINYNHGGHLCNPIGNLKYSSNEYFLYHYHYVSVDHVYNRYQMTLKRMSDINKKNGWGIQNFTTRDRLEQEFDSMLEKCVRIL